MNHRLLRSGPVSGQAVLLLGTMAATLSLWCNIPSAQGMATNLNHGYSVLAKEWNHVENGFSLAPAPAGKKRRQRRIKLGLTLIY
jgi:hypothetical protein